MLISLSAAWPFAFGTIININCYNKGLGLAFDGPGRKSCLSAAWPFGTITITLY
jgi:hypothetical protein